MINRFIAKQAGTRGRLGWRMPRAIAVAGAALLGILGPQGSPAWAQAGGTATESPTFFYSSEKAGQAPDKKEPLAPARDWVGVQLEPDSSMAETEKELKAKIQIDNGRAISEHKRAKILVFPVQAGKAESTKQQLRAQRQALKGTSPQLTASKLAIYASGVCHRASGLRARRAGLATADLMSR
jgi:hypothetical protein